MLHKKSIRTVYPAELHALFEEVVWGNPPSELIDTLLYYKSVGSTLGFEETTCLIVPWARKITWCLIPIAICNNDNDLHW